MAILRIINTVLILSTLSGCRAVHDIPETDDPFEKLDWAIELVNHQNRPQQAEQLIQQAIAICKKSNDNNCLGRAYLNYGFFFRSPSIREMEGYYREKGFSDKSATYDNRLIKSKEYFEKSIRHYIQTNDYAALTNAYLNLGFADYFLNTSDAGNLDQDKEEKIHNSTQCEAYAESLQYNLKNLEQNPNAKVSLPAGVSSFEQYIKIHQKRAGCL